MSAPATALGSTIGRASLGLALIALALVVAALPLEIAAALVGTSILVGLALVEPLVALGALLLAVPLSTVVSVEAGDFSVTAIEPLMALLVVGWLARGITRRDLPLRGGPLGLPLALLLLALLVSTLAAGRLGLAYKETIKWLELVGVYLFCLVGLREPGRQRAMLAVLFIAGGLEAFYGVFQYATGLGPAAFTIGEALRAYGHFDQPNPFAGYLATILPLALVLALRRRQPRLALLAAAAVAGTGAGILLSLSRGAWVGVLAALGTMLVTWGPTSRRWLAPGAGTLMLLVLLTATNLVPGGWSDRLVAVAENFGIFDVRTVEVTGENFAVVERMAHWQAAWFMLLEHPLLGVGVGNYAAAYDEYALPGWSEALGHAHNYYLNMAAEAGLLGLAALLFLLVEIFRSLARGLRIQRPGSFRHALLVGLLGSFIVLCVHNLFDNLLVHGMPVQVGLLMGLAAVNSEPATAGELTIGGSGRLARLE
jgi:putative inorganic carbon (hco3(-)) transporter